MELEIEEVHNIIKMLQSEDEDNHQVAFELINKLDFKKNLGEILIINKISNLKSKLWKETCKNINDFLTKELDKSFTQSVGYFMTYNDLFKILKKYKCSENSFKLYTYFYNEYITSVLHKTFDHIENFDISIKLKN